MAKELILNNGMATLVSDADYEELSRFRWLAMPIKQRGVLYGHYAVRKDSSGGTIYMHRVVLGAGNGQCVDHANRNGLDNRRENLRVATQSQNLANASDRKRSGPYRGVHKHGRKWRAVVGQNEYAGSYDTPEEAAHAYDEAALAKWGEFARPNFS